MPETKEIINYKKKSIIFTHKNYPIEEVKSYLAKRLFDIIISIFVIIFILSWLIPILAIIIRLNSKGPVFFIQNRIGYKGKIFKCIKLRTMVVNDLANIQQASNNDPRITKVGHFLRATSLDELPQFINVLAGSMSIVGPRPHMTNDCQQFSKWVENYSERYKVRPGITGIAQVKGFRGKTDHYFDILHRYKWDVFYIRYLSFNLDLKVIKYTFMILFKSIFFYNGENKLKKMNDNFSFKSHEYLN